MKRLVLVVIWAIFWLAVESTLFGQFTIVKADLVFIAVVAIGFYTEWSSGLIPVFFLGLFTDGVSTAPFGVFTFAYLATFSGIRFINFMIYVQSMIGRFIWTAAATMFAALLVSSILALIYNNPAFLLLTLKSFILQAVFNGLVGLAAIPFFNWYLGLTWEKLTRPKGLVLK